MKGFVPTPSETVDLMVDQLFRGVDLRSDQTVLDPGTGHGAFVEGIIRWCTRRRLAVPHIVGIDSDRRLLSETRRKLACYPTVELREADFLLSDPGTYDFVISNPPYVAITGLSTAERQCYRAQYETARGRFDLYLLFFEQALRSLKPGGRLVFLTPEKFLYVESAAPLRRLLARRQVEEVRLIDEDTFGTLITYPTVTTVRNAAPARPTVLIRRTGERVGITLPTTGGSWLPLLHGSRSPNGQVTLSGICARVSCGVATGADGVFVLRSECVDHDLKPFAHPTIAGRELNPARTEVESCHSMLVPYSPDGELLEETALAGLRTYLKQPERKAQLVRRTCAARKPWYAFHETPPLPLILRPKILCKDITARPQFWIDRTGGIVPRHSVYYIVPKSPGCLEELCQYLNSDEAQQWLTSHCQRAANGFLRLQSHVLKLLPIPGHLITRATRRSRTSGPGPLTSRGPQLCLPLRSLDADPV